MSGWLTMDGEARSGVSVHYSYFTGRKRVAAGMAYPRMAMKMAVMNFMIERAEVDYFKTVPRCFGLSCSLDIRRFWQLAVERRMIHSFIYLQPRSAQLLHP